jgi:hypothetical protein
VIIIPGMLDHCNKTKRGSKFRGVSRNGKKFQVTIILFTKNL